MNASDSTISGSVHLSPQMSDLLGELRASRKTDFETYILPGIMMAAFGVIAWRNGKEYAFVFFGALTVALMFHNISERRNRRQIDLVLALLAEQQKGNKKD
jgi:hypothetical protein